MVLDKRDIGLSRSEAALRFQKYGPNEIVEREKVSPLHLLLSQFEDPIVLIFIVSAAMSAFLGELTDFAVISAITAFIVLLGFFQEYKAEEALEKLKEMVVPTAKVFRGGKLRELPIEQVVPGDIISLEPGDMVPADCRILQSNNLYIDESILTGESKPVEKKAEDEVYRGTIVVRGTATAEVFATGSRTKFGKIAQLLTQESKSSIQTRSEELASVITKLVLAASALIAVVGFIRGASISSVVSMAIATAIAGIPEALPLTTTIVLALGVYRMAKHRAIVRRLSAVEELGTVTVICTDKTGTLTKNEMTVEKVFVGGKEFDVTGKGYDGEGKILFEGKEVSDDDLDRLLVSAVLCNNADLVDSDRGLSVVGDPTEISLLVLARKYGLNEDIIRSNYPRTAEEPFSSDKKYMVTSHRGKKSFKVMKGAPEVVFKKCSKVLVNGKYEKFARKWGRVFRDEVEKLASGGLRVLAVAVYDGEWVLLGVVGMQDPPRHGVKEAIKTAHRAGITVYMVTGDNPITAQAIGKQIGIEGGYILGEEIKKMSDEELLEKLRDTRILARIDPEEKLRIVSVLRKSGEIVAMTGDGVNDAPALNEADVGISMGGRGTEVAKGASDVVLADDNFVTIVEAVKRGRGIYENIRKFTTFLLSWNIGVTAMILFGVSLLGMGEAILLPLQILLLNVVLEDLPAIALGLDPVPDDIMKHPPRDPKESFVTRAMWILIVGLGMYMAVLSTAVFSFNLHSLEFARTLAFLSFAAFVIFNAFNFRSLEDSTFRTAFRRNGLLIVAVSASLLITIAAIYTHAGVSVFKFSPVGVSDWLFILGFSSTILLAGEVLKKTIRHNA